MRRGGETASRQEPGHNKGGRVGRLCFPADAAHCNCVIDGGWRAKHAAGHRIGLARHLFPATTWSSTATQSTREADSPRRSLLSRLDFSRGFANVASFADLNDAQRGRAPTYNSSLVGDCLRSHFYALHSLRRTTDTARCGRWQKLGFTPHTPSECEVRKMCICKRCTFGGY